jgi:gentisate 1,2-dioxygenase
VTLDVLLPGEATAPVRHNSTAVGFCIRGAGAAEIDDTTFAFDRHDVWCIPSMATYRHRNDESEVQARLTYSNAALLEKLRVHYVENDPAPQPIAEEETADEGDANAETAQLPETFSITDQGAQLMSYERLINPPLLDSRPFHWPWALVKPEVDKLHALGKEYQGRRLFLLHNPATGRTNGTTMNLFATMCLRPASVVDRPHRHIAAAINYFFAGRGHSVVDGTKFEWKAGDLMLSAPGWAIHHHASDDEDVYELTIQDSPLHLAMDSLWWQEDLRRPARLLGTHPGFSTNRDALLPPPPA